jgi:hypothetical protein
MFPRFAGLAALLLCSNLQAQTWEAITDAEALRSFWFK